MSQQPSDKTLKPKQLAVDLILLVAFFVYLYSVLRSHVPSDNPKYIMLWAAVASACMSGVFFLCIQMFRVVLREQQHEKKNKP
jgi:hypothetical protein